MFGVAHRILGCTGYWDVCPLTDHNCERVCTIVPCCVQNNSEQNKKQCHQQLHFIKDKIHRECYYDGHVL